MQDRNIAVAEHNGLFTLKMIACLKLFYVTEKSCLPSTSKAGLVPHEVQLEFQPQAHKGTIL